MRLRAPGKGSERRLGPSHPPRRLIFHLTTIVPCVHISCEINLTSRPDVESIGYAGAALTSASENSGWNRFEGAESSIPTALERVKVARRRTFPIQLRARPAQSFPISLKLQYRTSPRMM